MRAFICFLCLWGITAKAQQTQWFTPSDFSMTCLISKKCQVETECEAHVNELSIRHNPAEGPAFFELPENHTSSGVLGVVTSAEGQSIMASASPDGRHFFRIFVFSTGAVTVAKLNLIDNTNGTLFYGSRDEVIG